MRLWRRNSETHAQTRRTIAGGSWGNRSQNRLRTITRPWKRSSRLVRSDTRFLRTGAGDVVPEMVAGPKAFFVRNRFIASAAVAAAALSIVGLSIGSGHLVPPVISAHSAGSGVPTFGTTHDHDPSRSGGRGTSGSNGTGRHGYLRGRQFPRRRAAFGHRDIRLAREYGCGHAFVTTERRLHPDRRGGTGSSAPTVGGTGSPPTVVGTGPTTPTTPTTTTTIPVSSATGGPPPGGGHGVGSGTGNGIGSGSGNGIGSGSGSGIGSGSGNGIGSGSGNGIGSGSGNGFGSGSGNGIGSGTATSTGTGTGTGATGTGTGSGTATADRHRHRDWQRHRHRRDRHWDWHGHRRDGDWHRHRRDRHWDWHCHRRDRHWDWQRHRHRRERHWDWHCDRRRRHWDRSWRWQRNGGGNRSRERQSGLRPGRRPGGQWQLVRLARRASRTSALADRRRHRPTDERDLAF